MKLKTLFAAVALLLCHVGYAWNLPISHGPWITNVTETSFTVLWTTSEPLLCWVEAAPADGTEWYQTEHKKHYESVSGRRTYGTMHSITVSGLQPGTQYDYRIFGTEITGDDGHKVTYGKTTNIYGGMCVCTLDPNAKKCQFSMVNDIHFRTDEYTKLMEGMPDENDFILLNGDIVSHCSTMEDFIHYTFDPIAKWSRLYPVVFARGNHETRGPEWYNIPKVFPTPTNESYYMFREGPVAFLVLDFGEDKPDNDINYFEQNVFGEYRAKEIEWLKNAIQDPVYTTAPKKVCLVHISTVAAKDAWYTQNWAVENVMPILNDAGIDLMLSGHEHAFIFVKAGERGNNYDIIVNDELRRLDFSADSKNIKVKIYNLEGTLEHEYKF